MGSNLEKANLDQFKRLNLTEFLAIRGYQLDQRKSTQSQFVMKRGDGCALIVRQAENGHWTYFSSNGRSKGTIIDFLLGEGYEFGEAVQELKRWAGVADKIQVPESRYIKSPKASSDKKEVLPLEERAKWLKPIDKSWLPKVQDYLAHRKISVQLIWSDRIYPTVATDWRGNLCFPHYLKSKLVGWEIKNFNFTGFPELSQKGLWTSKRMPEDRYLAFFETGIDALSFLELHKERQDDCQVVSTAGRWGVHREGQWRGEDEIRILLAQSKGMKVLLCMDNDRDGMDMNLRLKVMAEEAGLEWEIHKPKKKDWNDDLKERFAC